MEEGTKQFIIGMISVIILVLIITVGICYYQNIQINNFQATIKDLTEEQKCLHICGFQFDGYLESYKFCAEKCDRISERIHGVGN